MSEYRIDYEKVKNRTSYMKKTVDQLYRNYQMVQNMREQLSRTWESPASAETQIQIGRLLEELEYSIRKMEELCGMIDSIALRIHKEDLNQAANAQKLTM